MRFVVFLLPLFLVGCLNFESPTNEESSSPSTGSCTGVTASNTYIYRVSEDSDNIYRAALDTSNDCLIEQTPTPLTSGDKPVSLAVRPDNLFLYVAKNGANEVAVYSLDQTTGEPTYASSVPTTTAPLKLLMSPTGTELFGLEYTWIVSYKINPATGALTWKGATSTNGGMSLAISADGAHLYASGTTSGTKSYDVDLTTALLSNPGMMFGTIANEMRLDPAGAYLYQANFMSYTTNLYDVDGTTGELTFNNFLSMPETSFTYYDLAFNTAGTRLYMLNNYKHFIESFSVNSSTGAITVLNRVTLAAGCLPESLALSSDEDFVFTGCTNTSGTTYVYKVEADGSLGASATSIVSGLKSKKLISVSF